ncbi:hypothetical protein F2Q69_00001982 [Brassica cretica]|uniref:Uncharacterized protein n=1 Tax=Brassica cretica TaxID=69181 RepID=A0A8S9P6L0_BRACR|nr:hypothetical protein F2Q69_00001982 [Brassica cretica]
MSEGVEKNPPNGTNDPIKLSRSSFDASVLVSSGMQLSTALCSPILGENSWLPFAGPFAPCIKRSQSLGFSVYWSKSLILKHCLLLGLLIWQWSSSQLSSFIKQDSESVAVLGGLFPKLPHALNGVGTGDSVSKMTLMFLLCEIVWNCQDAKEVSQALVGSALMVEALKLRSALLKAKELILLSFHIFSNSQVFTFTLRLGYVLNEIAGVFHDVVSLTIASLECMNVKNYVGHIPRKIPREPSLGKFRGTGPSVYTEGKVPRNKPRKMSVGLLIWQWFSSQLSSFINQDSESVAVLGGLFPKLPHALNGVGTGDSVSKMVLLDAETISSIASLTAIFDAADLLTMMALETLMFLPCEIVWNCKDAKEVSQALVGSALMVEALKLRSALLKAKELNLLSFHIFSNSRVFTFTLRLGSFEDGELKEAKGIWTVMRKESWVNDRFPAPLLRQIRAPQHR